MNYTDIEARIEEWRERSAREQYWTVEAITAIVAEWRVREAKGETGWTARIGPAAIDFDLEDGGVTCAYVRPDADSDEAIAGVTETDGAEPGEEIDRDAVLIAGIEAWLATPGEAELYQLLHQFLRSPAFASTADYTNA
ncbi:hypothetical protein RBB84_02490 [Rhodococcus sp. D-6]|uniref:Uncharacterized protein n=1 Tax=Rhodococcus sp. D-6 TaxID=1387842 RepID=A0AAU7UXY3_9NOCA|nr:hypothetical protein [Rhodococcus sp. HS-D2]